jgi:hypothetical protein
MAMAMAYRDDESIVTMPYQESDYDCLIDHKHGRKCCRKDGVLYKTDGSTVSIKPNYEPRFTVYELQQAVGGYFNIEDLGENDLTNYAKLGLPFGTVLVSAEKKDGLEENKRIHDIVGKMYYGDVLMCNNGKLPINAEKMQIRYRMAEGLLGSVYPYLKW